LDEAVGVFRLVFVDVGEEGCVLAVLALAVDFFAAASSCALAPAVKTHPSNKAPSARNHAFLITAEFIICTQIDSDFKTRKTHPSAGTGLVPEHSTSSRWAICVTEVYRPGR
jgi:hypothetical protein